MTERENKVVVMMVSPRWQCTTLKLSTAPRLHQVMPQCSSRRTIYRQKQSNRLYILEIARCFCPVILTDPSNKTLNLFF